MSSLLRPSLVASLFTAALLTGCATSQRTASADAPASKPAAEQPKSAFPVVYDDWSRLGYRLDWVGFPFSDANAAAKVVGMTPSSDAVIVLSSNSTISFMEAGTGQIRWSTDLTGPLTKWTGISREIGEAGRLLVSSESEVFMLAPGTGNLVGRERFERVINTPPFLSGNTIVAGTSTGVVQAHLIGRNVSAWNFGSSGSIEAPLTDVGGFIASVSQSGDVVFLSTRGDLVGRGRVLGPVDTCPTTDGQHLFIAGRDQSVWAFDTSGALTWRFRTANPLTKCPSYHNAVLYCDIGALGLTAFDAASGVVKWHAKDVHGEVITVRAGKLLVWDGKGVSVVDPVRGDRLDRVELPGVVRLVPDAFDNGNMFALSSKAVVAKFVTK